jgi:hypothetical protein
MLLEVGDRFVDVPGEHILVYTLIPWTWQTRRVLGRSTSEASRSENEGRNYFEVVGHGTPWSFARTGAIPL